MEKKSTNIKIIIVAIAAVILAAIIGIIVFSNSPAQKLKKQLDLGQNYLKELKYEEAIAVFKNAISIAPNSEEAKEGYESAYVGLSDYITKMKDYKEAVRQLDEAREFMTNSQKLIDKEVDVYLEWAKYCYEKDDFDDALNVLTEGYERLKDERLKKKIDEYTKKREKETAEKKQQEMMAGFEHLYEFMIEYYEDTILLGKHLYEWNGQTMAEYKGANNNVYYSKWDTGDVSLSDDTAWVYWSALRTLIVYKDDGKLIGTHIEELFEKMGLEYNLGEWPLEIGSEQWMNDTTVLLGYTDSGEARTIWFDVRNKDNNFEKGLYHFQIKPVEYTNITNLDIGMSLREDNLGEIEMFSVTYQ